MTAQIKRSVTELRYEAFISYRHVEPDRKWAKWLHGALETFRTPRELVRRGHKARLARVFRDEEELPADADLSAQIVRALDASDFLIVVCSPRAPESRWVNAEVEHFRATGRGDRILALLIEGEPRESFPRALVQIRRMAAEPGGAEQVEEVEPLAADVRSSRKDMPPAQLRRHAQLRILSCILGCRFDELRQREQERRLKRVRLAGVGLGIVAAAMAALSARALISAAEAEVQRTAAEASAMAAASARREAEVQRDSARREARVSGQITSIFTEDLLGAVDPYNSKGKEPTVGAVMQRIEARLGSGEAIEPDVERAVRQTLARVYGSLGQSERSWENGRRGVELAARERGERSLEFTDAVKNLLFAAGRGGARSEMIALAEKRLEVLRERFGSEDLRTIEAIGDLGVIRDVTEGVRTPDANPLIMASIAMMRGKGETVEQFRAYTAKSAAEVSVMWGEGRREDALARIDKDVRMFLTTPLWARAGLLAVGTACDSYRQRLELCVAAAGLEYGLRAGIEQKGPDHPEVLYLQGLRARVELDRGLQRAALARLEEAIPRAAKVTDRLHPELVRAQLTRFYAAGRCGDNARVKELLPGLEALLDALNVNGDAPYGLDRALMGWTLLDAGFREDAERIAEWVKLEVAKYPARLSPGRCVLNGLSARLAGPSASAEMREEYERVGRGLVRATDAGEFEGNTTNDNLACMLALFAEGAESLSSGDGASGTRMRELAASLARRALMRYPATERGGCDWMVRAAGVAGRVLRSLGREEEAARADEIAHRKTIE